MAKAPPPQRARLDNLPTRELIGRGIALSSAHNYKDAIDVYKLLLKREPQAESGWREPLATAYLERARQLAGKAMYREAAVLWENLPNLCGQAPHPEHYIDWLLRSGQHAKAMRAYAAHAATLSAAASSSGKWFEKRWMRSVTSSLGRCAPGDASSSPSESREERSSADDRAAW